MVIYKYLQVPPTQKQLH